MSNSSKDRLRHRSNHPLQCYLFIHLILSAKNQIFKMLTNRIKILFFSELSVYNFATTLLLKLNIRPLFEEPPWLLYSDRYGIVPIHFKIKTQTSAKQGSDKKRSNYATGFNLYSEDHETKFFFN
jgi:hypothetical protein